MTTAVMPTTGFLRTIISEHPNIKAFLTSASASDFDSNIVFETIEEELKKNGAEYVKQLKGSIVFHIKNNAGDKEGTWLVDVKNGSGSVKFDPTGKVKGDVSVTVNDENFMQLSIGELNPQQAFFQGKIKVSGNLGLAMKMQDFQKKVMETASKL